MNVSLVENFVAAVQAGAEEAVSAFSRTFDTDITMKVGKSGPFDAATFPADFWKPGLVLVLTIESQGVVIAVPSATGLVPEWCTEPDATGKSKLATFAQEWGMNLIPEQFFPEDNQAAVVPDIGKAVIDYGTIDKKAGYVELLVTQAEKTSAVYMVWPVLKPQEVLKTPDLPENSDDTAFPPPPVLSEAPLPVPSFIGTGSPFSGNSDMYDYEGGDFEGNLVKPPTTEDLPGFSQSLLKIRVPVAAVLARARKPIKTILELGIGSIIQFDKSCDDPLDLEIDRTIVGIGEAVKVGDKFGIRISTILLPKERFHKVEIRREGEHLKRQRQPQIIGKAPIKSLETTPQKRVRNG